MNKKLIVLSILVFSIGISFVVFHHKRVEALPTFAWGSANSGLAELKPNQTYWVENGTKIANVDESQCVLRNGELDRRYLLEDLNHFIPCWELYIDTPDNVFSPLRLVYVARASSTEEMAEVIRARVKKMDEIQNEMNAQERQKNILKTELNKAIHQ